MSNSFLGNLRNLENPDKNSVIKLDIIHQFVNSDFTIPDLSKEMNLSIPTITKIVSELIDEGFVHDFGKQGTNGGRKPNLYGLNPGAGYFIGVDIHKDQVLIGMINFKGQSIDYKEYNDFNLENTRQSLDEICKIINSFIKQTTISKDKIISIGINLSGRINSESGYSYSYFFFEERPITTIMEERLGYPVYIENDSRAMTYGEYMCGAANNEKNMLFLNVSWGLGMGIIIDGKLFYGKSGFSGEIGHLPFFDNEIICQCGKRGCLETEASASALYRIFLERLKDDRVSMLSEKYKKNEKITLADILDALLKEDVLAIEIVERIGFTLGRAVAGLINIFNPELIVIGGTLAVARDYLMLPMKSAINKHSLSFVGKDTQIKFSKLKEKAGVVGACMLVRSRTLGIL